MTEQIQIIYTIGSEGMQSIQWIFFDIGYTLVDEDAAHQKRIEAIVDKMNEAGRKISCTEIYDAMKIVSSEYKQPFSEALRLLGIDEKVVYPKEYEKVYDNASIVLSELKKNYNIGIIANQSLGTEKRLKKFGIMSYIDICIASAEEGIAKPDLGIFKLALKKAKCAAENAVMIGDRLDNDIFPSKKLGMKTVWIKQGFGGLQQPLTKEYVPDYIVEKLDDLILLFTK